MIIDEKTRRPLTVDGVSTHSITEGVVTGQRIEGGIKDEFIPHVLKILRSSLYSNSFMAIVREYSTNGIDGHIENGNADEPIIVTLPTNLNPNFIVRDFGPGMSPVKVRDVYALTGASTKGGSNDFTGAFGIGAKSAYSYTDGFTVNSYLDGVKYTYQCAIDEKGLDGVIPISNEPTNERNGVEVIIPVQERHFYSFKEAAESLFPYFSVPPILKNGEIKELPKPYVEGKGWKLYGNNNRVVQGSKAVMGNIPYPISSSDLNLNSKLASVINESVVLDFEIGDIQMAASREALQYTPATKHALVEAISRVADEIKVVIEKDLDSIASLWAAKLFYQQLKDSFSYLFRNSFLSEIKTWKGFELEGSYDLLSFQKQKGYETEDISVDSYSFKGYAQDKLSKSKNEMYIGCFKEAHFFINDCKRNIPDRLKTFFKSLNKDRNLRIYVVNYKSQDILDEFKKFIDGPEKNYYSLDAIEVDKVGCQAAHNKKHTTKSFTYDKGCIASSNQDYWKISDVDIKKDSGIYVCIDRFCVQYPKKSYDNYTNSAFLEPKYLKNSLDMLERLGFKIDKVYGFKRSAVAALEGNDNWVNLWDYVREYAKTIVENNTVEVQKHVNQLAYKSHGGNSVLEDKNFEGCFDASHIISKFREAAKETKGSVNLIVRLEEALNEFGVPFKVNLKDLKPEFDLETMYNVIATKYPMLKLLTWIDTIDNFSTVVSYVNFIDKHS